MPSLPQGLAGFSCGTIGGYMVDLVEVQKRIVVSDQVVNQWHKEANQ